MLSGVLLLEIPPLLSQDQALCGAERSRGLSSKRLNPRVSAQSNKRRSSLLFNPVWEESYLCQANEEYNTVTCLVCHQEFSSPKQYNLLRHYKNKHEKDYALLVGDDRLVEIARLKELIVSQRVEILEEEQALIVLE